MNKSVLQVIELGEEGFKWLWKDLYNANLAIIGSREKSNKKKLLQELSKKITDEDPKSVFWIGFSEQEDTYKNNTENIFSLIDFENEPTIHNETTVGFEQTRMKFVQHYLNALSLVRGKERTDLIPLTSYRKNVEGPLAGYIRSIKQSEESDDKAWLEEQLLSLEKITWNYQEGYKFWISEHLSPEESLLALIKGVWSYWAFTSSLIEPQQLMLIIDIPSKLTDMTTNQQIKDIVFDLLKIMTELSMVITQSAIISTETMYPIPELGIRHQLFTYYDSKDFDWRLKEIRSFFEERIIEKWINQDFKAGVWMDMSLGTSYILDDITKVTISSLETSS